ncbi:S1 RNA-binding domain-containing protein [Streptomyces sp. CPS1]
MTHMTHSTPDPLDRLRERLVAPGEVVTGTVAGFDGDDVLVLLDGDPGRPSGRVPGHELTWRRIGHPAELVAVGQSIRAEVTMRGGRDGRVLLSMNSLTPTKTPKGTSLVTGPVRTSPMPTPGVLVDRPRRRVRLGLAD